MAAVYNPHSYLRSWQDRYQGDLVEDILPFWLKHGLDRVNGGIYTCVDRDGSLIDTPKSLWFQSRFAFFCALAYNILSLNPDWL